MFFSGLPGTLSSEWPITVQPHPWPRLADPNCCECRRPIDVLALNGSHHTPKGLVCPDCFAKKD